MGAYGKNDFGPYLGTMYLISDSFWLLTINHHHTLMELTSYNKPRVSRSKKVSSYISGRVNPSILWLNLRIGDFQFSRHFMPRHRVDEGAWGRSTQIPQTDIIDPLNREMSLHCLLKDSWGKVRSRINELMIKFLTTLAILVFHNWRGASKKEDRSWGDLVDKQDKQCHTQLC